MFVFAHLSDTHLDGGERSAARTRAAMDHLDALPWDLDAVLVTGDIADNGTPAEYDTARALLASRHPVLIGPGNHDVRGPFRENLLGEPAGDGGPINRVLRTASALYAMCDSSIPGRHDGLLAPETLAWLSGVLDESPPSLPVFVAFHHPPVELRIPFLDAIRQFGEADLADLVARHPNIAALLCGHVHTPAATTFAGRPLLLAPGIVSTLSLPWERGDDEGHVDPLLPPMLTFNVWDAGRLTTHYRVVGSLDTPIRDRTEAVDVIGRG
ncbi:metallophosphoesterase [Streptomyces sp. SID3343]|uniref:metallophosphoesterase n=1 Tax=Streptomyces sp. SID3343 TaxID=2690260 RepID=UPI001370B6D2|nr:metallophosphoesterase [Streptomyces sp. SID3343]MYW01418.1 phosphodiesterase [Streptomyces sp. SID3343]